MFHLALFRSPVPPWRLQGIIVSLLLGCGSFSSAHAQVTTTTALSIAAPTVAVGVPTLLTATVTDASNHSVHLGTVAFYDGTRLLGSAQIVSGSSGAYPQGTANLKTASFSLGANSITAVFGGTTSDLKSTSSATTVTVTGKNLTTTALSGYVTGTDFFLTAALEAFGSGTPTGSVDFSHISHGVPIETIDTKSLSGAKWGTGLSISSEIGTFNGSGVVESDEGLYDDVVTTGDFNGDGFVDLATPNYGGNASSFAASVQLGKGDGAFTPSVTYAVGKSPESIYSADFNNDGRLDLAVVNEGDHAIGILLGNGDGTFQPQIESGAVGAEYAYVADLNRDGNLDIVVGSVKDNADTAVVLLGGGGGTFHSQTAYPVGSGAGPIQVIGGDLNGDGIPDLVVATTEGENVLLGKGDGTFLPATVYAIGSSLSNLIALGDVDGDGKLDLVWSSLASADPSYGYVGTVGVALGKGDGTFENAKTYPISGYPLKPVLVDLNQDGKLDIVLSVQIVAQETGQGNNAQLLAGNGDGTFQPAVAYLQNAAPWTFISADFNGDGRPDLAGAGVGSHVHAINGVYLNGQTTSVQVARDELGPGWTTVEASYEGDGAFAGNVSNEIGLTPNEASSPDYPYDFTLYLRNGSATPNYGFVNGEPNQAGSIYYAAPQNVQAFTTDFEFSTFTAGSPPKADGITFVIQNDGPQALGGIGGGLGYEGINKSVAIKFDLYNNSGEGNNSTGLYTDGASPTVPAIDLTGSGINLQDSARFDVHITYDGATLTLKIVDSSTNAAFSYSWPIDIPAVVGGPTAYVGFTGATGGVTSLGQLYSWTYQPGVY